MASPPSAVGRCSRSSPAGRVSWVPYSVSPPRWGTCPCFKRPTSSSAPMGPTARCAGPWRTRCSRGWFRSGTSTSGSAPRRWSTSSTSSSRTPRQGLAFADSLLAEVAPVGMAWWMALAERRDIDLYQADGSHPSVAGSYLAAVVDRRRHPRCRPRELRCVARVRGQGGERRSALGRVIGGCRVRSPATLCKPFSNSPELWQTVATRERRWS